MKINHYINNRIAAAMMLLLSLFFLPACSNEEDVPVVEPEQLYTVTLSLQSSDNYKPETKAESWEKEEDAYERRVDQCWVVIYNEQGYVATVTANNLNGNTQVGNATQVGTMSVELPVGMYRCYAFANLNSLNDPDNIITGLNSGTITADDLEKLSVSLKEPTFFYLPTQEQTSSGLAIPMSSYATPFEVAEDKTTVDVTLFRMIGKVEIQIDNQTGSNLILKSLSMGNFRNGPVYLLPYKEGEITLNDLTNGTSITELLQPKFPENVSAKSYNQEVSLPQDGDLISNEANKAYKFYAYETGTTSNAPSGGDIGITIKVNDRSPYTAKTNFSFIRRNDWLKIPIVMSNVETTMTVETMRMPIGGLPKTFIYGEENGIQVLLDADNVIEPDYTGPVIVKLTVNSVTAGGGTVIKNLTIVDDDATTVGNNRSSVTLSNNEAHLLINKEKGEPLDTNSIISLDTNKNECTFSVWTQELANDSEAVITLKLVAAYDGGSINIPYTIRIRNYEITGGN